MWAHRELYQAAEPSLAAWERVEVPRGPCPGPRRERRATCAEDDGATLQTADHRPGFCVLGVSIASAGLDELPSRSTAAANASSVRRSWLRTGLWGANDARECSQEEGKEEGKEPSPGAHERNQAAARAIRPGRTTGFEDLRAQPAPGRLQVGIPIFGVNLGSLEPTPASTGSESRSRSRDSHCEYGVDKVCQGHSDPLRDHQPASCRMSNPNDSV